MILGNKRSDDLVSLDMRSEEEQVACRSCNLTRDLLKALAKHDNLDLIIRERVLFSLF